MSIFKTFEKEINSYLEYKVDMVDGYKYSQADTIKRIKLYQDNIFATGKFTSQGEYKFWFDIIAPRVNSEVKNIDFDTKDILLYSDSMKDTVPIFISNLGLKEYLRDTGKAVELNEAVEQGAGWGNVVWKKIKNDFEMVDLSNFYVINQTAKTLKDSPAIERHIFIQTNLRAKKGVWDNVEEVIKFCGNRKYEKTEDDKQTTIDDTEVKYYEIYERNGEISQKQLFEAQGKGGGNEDKYVLAKIIIAGLKKAGQKDDNKFVLFAEEISEMPYKEYHRLGYKGRWFRKGLYEILFDCQTRANEISNQMARGLAWASKIIFRSSDEVIAQNILTDMQNGDIIKSEDLQQVVMRIPGFDQLANDWNRIMDIADRLANSFEVVTGESLPSGTPFRLGAQQNLNANKLFDFIRENLGLVFQDIFQDWVLKDVLKDLKAKDVLRLTGDTDYLDRFYEMVAQAWYIGNLLALGPHTSEMAKVLKQRKIEELKQRPEQIVKLSKKIFEGLKPRVQVIITGENVNIAAEMETLANFIQLEADPVRRSALIEMAMKKKGLDVASLAKTEIQPEAAQPNPNATAPRQEPVMTA